MKPYYAQSNFQVAEITLQYQSTVPYADRVRIRDSQSAYDVLMHHWSQDISFVEEFKILLLDQSNAVLGIVPISKGGLTGTVVDARLLFSAALLAKSSSIILAHNHPTGNMRPSQQDIQLTKKLIEGAKHLDLRIFDHLIICEHSYYSFTDEGLI